jgi:hypothetical protein
MEIAEKGPSFSMFSRIGLCVGLEIFSFFQVNGIAGFYGLNLFS